MFRNYLLVSFRNLRRHFTYSFVNIFGLTIGLACTIVIGMWVYQETSYDKHFKNSDKIFRVGVNFFNVGDLAVGPEVLAAKLHDFPQMERTTNLRKLGERVVKIDNKEFTVKKSFEADSDFFQLFSYSFSRGDASALDNRDGIVITEELAYKLFDRLDVINETIQMKSDLKKYVIRGVVSNQEKSHIKANMWVSSMGNKIENTWTSAGSYSYVFVNADNPRQILDESLESILKKDIQPVFFEGSYEEFQETGIYKFLPIAIQDIHLRSSLKFETSPTSNEVTVKIFAGVALLILLLASINFINISTARATVRAKEIGVRKSLGTSKWQLVLQFLLESVIICLIAVSAGIVVGDIFLQLFEQITGLELLNSLFTNTIQLVITILGAIMLGIITGIFPAFYITRFEAVKVLKGTISIREKGMIRSGLVLFQFVISISLLIVSLFVFSQLDHIQNQDMGFETENVLIIPSLKSVEKHQSFIKQELQKLPQVASVSINRRTPATEMSSVESVFRKGSEEELYLQRFVGDYDLIETYGFRLIDGRNFSQEMVSDSAAIILNEAAVFELGLENPVGKTLNDGDLRIIGVVSDFNYESLKNQVSPVMLKLDANEGRNLSIKFLGDNPEPLISELRTIWKGLNAENNFDYYFLDENFEQMVSEEKVLSKAILLFTSLAMIISCLGLYGLSVFTAERKVKEIGIRRVLGASVLSITRLLSGSFAIPIAAAFLISIPISYLAVDTWLSDYAYRVNMSPFLFFIGGVVAMVIGLVTVSWQSIKTALRNPVISLRSE